MDKMDRCDACNAQAFVKVGFGNEGTLMFCAHDFHKNSDKVSAQGGYIIVDKRESINHRPSVSASV